MDSEEKTSIMIDSDLWQRFHVFITMAYRGTGDVVEYAERATRAHRNLMKKCKSCVVMLLGGINDVFVEEE